jgi:prolyl oligopeptidase
MRLKSINIIAALAILVCSCSQKIYHQKKFDYPIAPSQPVIEEYCGITIEDTYRNLENLSDKKVLKWFKDQGEYADGILSNIQGTNEIFNNLKDYQLRQNSNVRWITVTEKEEYFYIKTNAEDYTGSLYYRKDLNSPEELVFDPKIYENESGNRYVIRNYEPSWQSDKVAIAITYAGKEFSDILILDIESKKTIVDKIERCWYIIGWTPDDSGILFTELNENYKTSGDHFKNMRSALYKLGSNEISTSDIFSRNLYPDLNMTESDLPFLSFLNKEDKYAVGRITGATAYHDAYYAETDQVLDSGSANWKSLYKKEDKVRSYFIHNDDLFVISGKNSSAFQILRKFLDTDQNISFEVIVNPKEDEVIKSFRNTSKGIVYTTARNGIEYKMYHFDGSESRQIILPISAGGISLSTKSDTSEDLWTTIYGWTSQIKRYKYDWKENKFNIENLSSTVEYPEFDNIVVEEVEVTGHDGEKIPLSIIYDKEITLNNSNPTIMYGYGSYGISNEPNFSPTWLHWTQLGGIIAMTHVRGGSEKGDEWYQDGKKNNKPNTWKDMNSCTEYMINKGFTSKDKTIIYGRSAGGILVGRAITERPDLYGVAISQVGSLNVLRSEVAPNGANNTKEFGSFKNADECEALVEMDAYLHLEKDVSYPATLLTAGLNDPRVVSWIPGKFAAKLQAYNSSDKPILFKFKSDDGHGMNSDKWERLNETANIYSFALWQTGNPKYTLNKQ